MLGSEKLREVGGTRWVSLCPLIRIQFPPHSHFIPGQSSSHLASEWIQEGRCVRVLCKDCALRPQTLPSSPPSSLALSCSLTQGICFPILVWDGEHTHHLMALLP